MNKWFTLIIFIFFEKFSLAIANPTNSVNKKWIPYFTFSYLNSWHQSGPIIWNMPGKLGYYKVIPVGEFKTERKGGALLLTKPEYSFCLGIQNRVVNNGILGAEFRFSQIVNSHDARYLIFSDMVDPVKGS